MMARQNRLRAVALAVAGAFVMNLGGAGIAVAQVTDPAPGEEPASSPISVLSTPAAAANGESPAAAIPEPTAPAERPVYTGPRMGLLVMPFESQVEEEGNTLGPQVAKAMKDATLRSRQYAGVSYNPKHPIVRRALDEGELLESEVNGPFGIEPRQVQAAVRIARMMEIPRVMVGSITDFEFDREKREGQITVTAEIINTSTGRMDGPAMIATGRSPAVMTSAMPEQYALAATEDAALQLAGRMPGTEPDVVAATNNGTTDQETTEPTPQPEPKKKKNSSGLLAALAVLGLIIAGSGGGGGGGDAIDLPPPAPF